MNPPDGGRPDSLPFTEDRPDRPPRSVDDPRVFAALQEYLAALEAGQRPDRQAFLERHADVGAALAECLDGMEALHGVASHGAAAPATVGGTPVNSLGEFCI